jgi:hypothetical protein
VADRRLLFGLRSPADQDGFALADPEHQVLHCFRNMRGLVLDRAIALAHGTPAADAGEEVTAQERLLEVTTARVDEDRHAGPDHVPHVGQRAGIRFIPDIAGHWLCRATSFARCNVTEVAWVTRVVAA